MTPPVENAHPTGKGKGGGADALSLSLDEIAPLLEVSAGKAPDARVREIIRASRAAPGTITLTDYFRILKELSVALHDETLHLSSRHLMPGTTGFIVSNLSSCATLVEAMKLVAKSYNLLHGGTYNRVEERPDALVYVIDDASFPYQTDNRDYIHLTMECVLIFLHGLLAFISSDDLLALLRKVYTKRPRGPMQSRHMIFWNAPVRYRSNSYTLIYDPAAARLPVFVKPGALPSLREIYDRVIDMIKARFAAAPGHYDTASRVCQALEQGLRSQPAVARQLGVSVATLRRRLNAENTDFRTLHRTTLNTMAKQLLAQNYHVGDIAEELGFSDFRSFIRAFKAWNGQTPRTWKSSRKA